MASAIVPTYARANVAFERGEGSWLIDDRRALSRFRRRDRRVLRRPRSSPSGRGAHQPGLEAVARFKPLPDPEGERFARRLVDATFADLIFFANSGAEANEAAIKMARRRHSVDGHPERYRTLTFEGAFHGRTLAMIAAGGQAKYLDGFGPKVDGFDQIPVTDLDAVEAAIGPETGMIMIEPIQGEGGVRVIPRSFLRGLREICDRLGLILIFDEVQTGVGRTGKFFAYEHCGIHPDILTSAKGIGGGFPMSACLATADAARGLTTGVHGTTFGGNPAGDGGRQRHARRHPRARLSRAGREARSGHAPEARGAQGPPSRRDRGDPRRGADGRSQAQASAGQVRRRRARAEASRHSRRRQCRCASCRRSWSPTRRSPKACGGSTRLAKRSNSA